MKPAPFAYCRPATLAEALDTLARHGDARILAGGQSLMPALNMRLAQPGVLVDINRLPGLDGIHVGPEGLVIGALARHEAVLRSSLVARHAPLIAQAMPHVAHLALRTRGTVGGSLALADPAAELPACAVALDAVLRVARHGGERVVRAAAFFHGIYTTALEPGEILEGPVLGPPALGRLRSVGQRPDDRLAELVGPDRLGEVAH
ncbi:MAG TPA: FAD binding domain-containing protein, partial [Methylomirabilota bacterium]|nr:FAD binding domain-containing protein [Methylomirabilota bacterium]